ncbi:MAG: hypothetical protein V5B07_10555 [Candidatus Accumulibacter sp. UW27]|jgi:hypothetical protein
MSDSANVFTDLNQFSTRLGTLLSSNAAGQAAKIAQRLHAEKPLNAGIDTLIHVLNMLASALVKLDAPLKKAGNVAAGCEAIADSLDAFGDGKSLVQVAKRCGQSDAMVQPVVDKIVQIRGPLKAALDLLGSLPTPGELSGLCKHLTALAGDLKGLKAEVEEPLASISTPTPSTTGGKLP